MGSKELPNWVRWPQGEAGFQALAIRIDKPVDDVFQLIYGSETNFAKEVHAAVGNKDVVVSDWRTSTNQFDKLPDTNAPPALASLRPGCVRRTRFAGFSMGSKFTTDQLSQLEEAVPGERYSLEMCVATTATYGDKFRPVLRHALRAAGPAACTLRVAATIVFVGKVNGFVRGMIERGARDGILKNFASFRKILQAHAGVEDAPAAEAGAEEGAAATGPPAAALAATEPVAELPPLAPLARAVGEPMERALAPWAAALQRLLGLPGPAAVALHAALGAALALATLQLVLQALLFLRRASHEPTDVVSGVAHMAFRVFRFPESAAQVLSSALILFLVRTILGALTAVVPAAPTPEASIISVIVSLFSSSSPSSSETTTSVAAVVSQEDGGASTAAPSPSPEPKLDVVREESEAALEGVKYEGYSEAISSAQGQITYQSFSKSMAALFPFWVSSSTAAAAPEETAPEPKKSASTSSTPRSPGQMDSLVVPPRGESESELAAEKLMSPKGRARELSRPVKREAGDQAVIEEIFENERLQPFRGWGHSWPGHFLPTDRVAHWSLREAPGTAVVAAQEFKRVAPRVPKGWRWVESTWHLDLSGSLVDAVDADGWAYGLDFGWLQFPFAPGAGGKKYSNFVRRRRWIRTRVPLTAEERAAAGLAGELRGAGEGEEAVVAAEPQVEGSAASAASRAAPATPEDEPVALDVEDRILSAQLAESAVAAALRSVELEATLELGEPAPEPASPDAGRGADRSTVERKLALSSPRRTDDESDDEAALLSDVALAPSREDSAASDGGHLCLRASPSAAAAQARETGSAQIDEAAASPDTPPQDQSPRPDSGHLML